MTRIRLRSHADLLAALPYQLGYHPRDCLVAVALHGRTIGLVQRLDLPPAQHVDAAARTLAAPLLREEPDAVQLVGYESTPGAARPLLDAVRDALGPIGLSALDRLVVSEGRWYALDCAADCCPTDGEELPEPSQTPAIAEFVALEMAPLPERDAVAALVAPTLEVCRPVSAALRGGTGARWPGDAFGLTLPERRGPTRDGDEHGLAVRRLSWLSLWGRAIDVSVDGGPVDGLSATQVADLVLSLQDIELRDGLIAWLCPGTLPLDQLPDDLVDAMRTVLPPQNRGGRGNEREAFVASRRLLARLQWLARAVPDSHCAAMLTVLANCAWWLGDGTLARVALDRALTQAPDYRLAVLLARMVDHGVRLDQRQPPCVPA